MNAASNNPETEVSNGLITIPSASSVDVTLQRLVALLRERNVNVFAVIDHSGEAAKVGLPMRNTKLLIFGSPKAGTPVMQAAPMAAIDLPLKALLWEDANGKTQLTYNDPAYLQQRHKFPEALVANLSAVSGLFVKATQ